MGCCGNKSEGLDGAITDLLIAELEDLFIKEKIYKVKIDIRKFTGKVASMEITINPESVRSTLDILNTLDYSNELRKSIHKQLLLKTKILLND